MIQLLGTFMVLVIAQMVVPQYTALEAQTEVHHHVRVPRPVQVITVAGDVDVVIDASHSLISITNRNTRPVAVIVGPIQDEYHALARAPLLKPGETKEYQQTISLTKRREAMVVVMVYTSDVSGGYASAVAALGSDFMSHLDRSTIEATFETDILIGDPGPTRP